MKLLVIEPQPKLFTILAEGLPRFFSVHYYQRGEKAFSMLRTLKPQGIVLDFLTPRLMGLDMIQKIKIISEFKQIPIFLFLFSMTWEHLNEQFQMGRTIYFLDRLAHPALILERVRTVLMARQMAVPSLS
jgi:DNA-binding response OmpR family regulator